MGLFGRIGRNLPLVIVLILLAGCFSAPPNNDEGKSEFEKTVFVMDTFVTIQFFSDSEEKAEEIFTEVEDELTRLESILSSHSPGSDIAKIDEAAGIKPVAVNSETLSVLATALEYANRTEGSFDVSLAPILQLYNFIPGQESSPTRQQLESNLDLVDWRRVKIDQDAGTVFLEEKDMKIDLGGIAKGFITDQAANILVRHGIEYGLVNAGGDIRLLGPKIDGSPWRVGVKDPNNPNTKNFAIVEIAGGSIVTSGDYERYYIEDGVRYHHIIDPKSGLPADLARSVTVIAPNAELADLLSTAVFVLGPDSGLQLIETLAGVEALFWSRSDEVLWSSGLSLVPNGSQSAEYYLRID